MAWMHTVCVGPDLAEAKVRVWLNAPLDKTGHPFILHAGEPHTLSHTHTYTHAQSDKKASTLQWLSLHSPLITEVVKQRSAAINIST